MYLLSLGLHDEVRVVSGQVNSSFFTFLFNSQPLCLPLCIPLLYLDRVHAHRAYSGVTGSRNYMYIGNHTYTCTRHVFLYGNTSGKHLPGQKQGTPLTAVLDSSTLLNKNTET